MSAQNYHPETVKNNAVKYVTSIEDENFKYYWYRDISGPISIPESNYLTIEIDYECFPSDAMTCMDYVVQKQALLQRNLGQDFYTKYLPESRVKKQKFFLSTHSYCVFFYNVLSNNFLDIILAFWDDMDSWYNVCGLLQNRS